MLRKSSVFLILLSLFVLLALYHYLQEDTSGDEKLALRILEGMRSIKCSRNTDKHCPTQTSCPPTNSHKRCPIFSKHSNVIKMQEMTKVLNARDSKKEAVFFTETSGTGAIKPRFVCGIESAARVYQNADVYLLVAYSSDELQVEKNEALRKVLRLYKNVTPLYVDLELLFRGSELEEFYKRGTLNSSLFLAAHTSDIIRVLTLWLYGGKYFDMDIITVRNLTGINNFIIDESQLPYNYIANGAFAMEKRSPVGSRLFQYIKNDFNGTEWANNGPKMLLDAMVWYTGASEARFMNKSNLREFVKLKYEQLFPIEYFELETYFDEKNSTDVMKRISAVKNLIGLHIGNNISKDYKVIVGSTVAYSQLAQKYCPRAYWSADLLF